MWHNPFRHREEKECEAVGLLLARQLGKDPLSAAEAARLESHLATCPACQERARQEQFIHGRFHREMPPIHRLSPANAAHIQAQVQRRLWRKKLMLQTKETVRGLAALVLLILFAAAVFWWWRNFDLDALAPINTPILQEAEQVTITLAVAESNLAGYRPLIEQFEAQHNHIRVRLVAESEIISSEETDRIAALAAAADLFFYLPDVHEGQSYLLDLRPLLLADPTFDPNDFLPGLLDDDDNLWSLPIAASYPVIFFNKAALDAAGLAYPEPGWTLDEFLTTAKTLTLREENEVSQWGYVPFQVRPLLATQLTSPLVMDGQSRFTDPDVADTVQWLADLFTLHEVSPWLENYKPLAQRETTGGPDPIALVREGRAAMWSADHTLWQSGFGGDDIGLTTIPRNQQSYAADAVRYAFAISRGTRQPQAAWQLLTFLSQQPPSSGMADLLVPARYSTAAAMNYWQSLPGNLELPLSYAVENNRPSQLPPGITPLNSALVDIVENDIPAAVALAALEQFRATTIEPVVVDPPIAPTPITEAAVTHIQFATTWNEEPAHRGLARIFTTEHPEVAITVSRELSLNAADCFAAPVTVLPNIRVPLLPLDPFFELDVSISSDDFYPGLFTQLRQDNQIIGLPAWINVPFIEYNRSLFTELGVAEPTVDWTLTEFLQTAQALSDESVGRYAFIDWTREMLDHGFTQFGIDPLIIDENGTALNFAATEPIILWYADLVRLHRVQAALPGDLLDNRQTSQRWGQFENMIEEGAAAMWPGSISAQGLAGRLAQAQIEVGIAPIPRGPSGHNINIADRVTAYFITAQTPHHQLCWEWINFLSAQPTASLYLPARIEIAESADYTDHVGARRADIYRTAPLYSSDDIALSSTRTNWLSPGMLWLGVAYEQVAKEENEIGVALAEAAGYFERYRACVVANDAFAEAARWRQCAVDVDGRLADRYGD
jgi:ABC-type glycerol-3-phosphate transport system substrate-binding protein